MSSSKANPPDPAWVVNWKALHPVQAARLDAPTPEPPADFARTWSLDDLTAHIRGVHEIVARTLLAELDLETVGEEGEQVLAIRGLAGQRENFEQRQQQLIVYD